MQVTDKNGNIFGPNGVQVNGSNGKPKTTGGGGGSSPLTTKGDLFTHNVSADTRLPVGLDTQVLLADSTTSTGLKWGNNTTPTPTGYYAQYQDDITQTAVAINTGYPIKFRTLDYSNGISVVSNSRITIANTGIYNLQFSVQLENSSNQEHDATIWLRKNGTDVAGSAGFISIASSHGGVHGHVISSWNYLLDAVGGDYYELVWSVSNTAVTMPYYPGANPPPSAASAIFTVTQQAGIMAGTGMTALNGLSGAVQTFATNGSGSDFNISSSGSTHTFNLPTASATNRGALSTTDWTTFNGKEPSITAGTTSEYYRGDKTFQTLDKTAVGLGNVDNTSDANKPVSTATSTALSGKQDTLVSGTNIKTVNSTSLLGSGDILINSSPILMPVNSTGVAVTNTTVNTISIGALTPPTNFVNNATLQIRAKFFKTAGTSATTFRIYINTSNSLTGATLLGTAVNMTAASQFQLFNRDFFINGTTLRCFSATSAASTDIANFSVTNFTVTASTNYYFIIAIQHAAATDSATCLRFQIFFS